MGFPDGTSGKEPTCQCRLDIRDAGSIPGSGRSPGEGNGNPLQYSCLENLMDRGVWRATVHGSRRVGHVWSDLAHMNTICIYHSSIHYSNILYDIISWHFGGCVCLTLVMLLCSGLDHQISTEGLLSSVFFANTSCCLELISFSF